MNGHALDAGGPRFAIVGIGCRLPGSANDHRAFWTQLAAGQSCVVDAPASRYDAATLVSRDPGKPGRRVGGRGGYIDGLDEFDPAFFGIGAREAKAMDPQQRKLLEVAWEALEDAGLRPAELAGRDVGVFIGASAVDYQILQFADPGFEQLSEHTAAGTALAMVAGRISHCFDFRGPSMAVDTAGSSSLVAVHLACRSLAAGETSLALAGGVALDLAPQYAIAQTRSGWLSPDGRSRPFDAGANGWVRAEAAAVVVLKRLAEALRDGDPIHAVIAGSGASSDGRTAGIAVPGGDVEIALIRRVCRDAGVSPGALQYVEAHAASMPIGDAIEASALGAVLSDGREPNGRCCIGSVAGNLGHAGAAAGIAGLIKVALALKHKQIPPHIGLDRIHPAIDLAIGLDRAAIEIPTRLIAWPPHVRPARAGVCALGIGGTHAHVVMEEPPAERRPASHAVPGYNLVPLTARDPSVFRAMVAALARELHGDHGPAPAVADVGYTLARRRQHLEARLCFVYSSAADLAEVLAHHLAGEASPRIVAGSRLDERRRRLAWVFTGAGAEWWAMGRELLASEPVYRGVIERCDRAITRLAGWSLIDELTADEAASNMAEPCLAGPALFALQIGLAALWRSLGARPDAIVGHGAGELAAFHEAGVYSLEEAVQIAIHRSRLMHDLAGSGAMLAVGLSEAAAEARIAPVAGQVAIAAIDGPSSVALSGDRDALDAIRAQLAAEQVAAQWLPVAVAYHSPAMDRIRDELVAALADLHPRPAMLPLYLTAAEGTAGGPELDAAYWWRNVRDPVRFRPAIDRMIDAGCGVFLELGPHPMLGGAIADCLAARGADGRVVPSLRRGETEPCQIMASLAALHAAGLDIAWDQLYPAGRIVPLPGYPWRRDRYWTEPAAVAQVRLGQRDHELLGRRLPAIEPVWEARIDLEQLPYLADHRLGGRAVFPAAGHLAMAAQAVRVLSPGRCVALGEVELGAPLVLDDRAPAVVQLAIGAEASALRIASPAGGDAVVHATAVVRVGPARRLAPPLDVAARRARAEVHRDAAACYAALAELGQDRGPAFRAIEEIWVSPGEALARVRAPASLGGAAARYHVHPCLLDACFQTLQCPDSLVGARPGGAVTGVPTSIAEVRICEVGDRPLWVHAAITARSAGEITGDIAIYGEAGQPLGAMTGVRIARAEPAPVARPTPGLFEVAWVELPALADDGPAVAPGEPWIVLADAHGVGAALAQQIEARGARAWLVRPGSQFALDREQRAVTIDPGSAADAGALLAAIAQRSQGGRCRIVHLWSLDAPALAGTSTAQLRDAAAHATCSLVVLAQALLASELAGELSIVTRGTQAVTPGAAVEPAGAPAWGIGRALRDHALSGWRGKLIDLEPGERPDGAAALARELVAAGEDELALRGGRRFTPRLVPAAGPAGSLAVRLRPDGTYLVVGAFGALGRRLCRRLVERGARRLIAMSRSKLPPRIAWHALDVSPGASPGASLDLDASAAERVRFVQELEALGAEVIAAPVDITDEPALAGWLVGFRALRYPPIRGVFHAAGQSGATPVSELDPAAFRAVHDPKLIGAYLLHKHTAGEPLDHFAMFSSIASLLPAGGQAHGAAGEAFLDALAHHRRSAGLPGLSVSWGPCADAAIAATDRLPDRRFDVLLDRLLGDDRAQVAVAAVDWRELVARHAVVPRLLAGIVEDTEPGPGRPAAVDVYTDETCFPLSRNQQALWIVNQLDPDTVPYHLGDAVDLHARLDPELVFAAVRVLVRRHPMLRARIAVRDGRPVHRIARDVTADVKLIDVRGWTWLDIHAALLREYRKPFDLEREPLLRFRLLQRADRRFVALQVVHRIISDAASTGVFLDELLAVYDALRRGVDPVLPPLPARYLDFVNWQNRLLASPEAEPMLRYWIENLPAELPALSLPTDRPRPDVQTHHGASQSFVLGSDLTARVQAMAQVTGATPFAILLAAYCILLHRYTGQDDLIVGSPVAGRTRDELAAIYGSFANALPLQVSLAGDPAFLALLDRVRATVQGALDHQDYPLAQLVEELGLPHDPGRSPVFQVMFELLDRVTTERRGVRLDRIELPEQAGPLDLTLSIREDEPEHALRCTLTYNRDLFEPETIRRMASHYSHLVVAAIADPLRPVSELEMLGGAERARIVQRWSGADVAVVPDRPVHAMIRRHAVMRPDALAVIAPGGDGARIVTYGELDAAAAQLARRLQQLGAGDRDVVAVCLDRSPELVIALLGILQAGAVYLAVDPGDPDDRIASLIERAGARFLIGAIAGRLTGLAGCTRLSFEDALGDAGAAAPDPAPGAGPAGLDHTACVFHAPGSTAQPLAVAISHRSLASAYHAWDVTYRLRSEARVHLQTARGALDRFTGGVVRALCSGGALCLAGEPLVRDLARMYDSLVHHAVDTAELTPAIARALTAHCLRDGKRLEFLRLVVLSPGAWTVDDDRQLRALLGRRSRLIQVYGATEATIDSACFEGPVEGLPPDRQVPIGGPFPGSRVFVLDRHGAPVPAGVPGELWLGGNGVAAGYLRDPDASAARFKIVELDERGVIRLFRTGDLARWDARGTLHAVGTTPPDDGAASEWPARKG